MAATNLLRLSSMGSISPYTVFMGSAIRYACSPTPMLVSMVEVIHVLQTHEGQSFTPAVQQQIADIVLPHIDFMTMSRFVMSQYWSQMTPAQRDELVRLFKRQLVQTYMGAFGHYSGQKIRILISRQIYQHPNVVQVDTMILQTNGLANIPVTYVFLEENSNWKIYNVFIDGISMNLSYRETYGQKVTREGIAHFLRDLGKKEQSWMQKDR
ncbi:ABC transporter substrate-binding protein [Acidithiobacillus thiooxidans]|uniref:MlaC/ttg2D family ABC transporter substrate-binding protein n=1 Tax=Acidithiobacillus thiooxidans TaxID=930 RepID=UPI002855527B|nr:ABC transporter substrate-binding protein [Acidithiobacillus thiooxidans]MDR7926865.1 ABC transporter substrate-binding protein [Acidithiobacillus thiooxidans]